MQALWIKYDGAMTKYVLIIYLGEHNNKVVAIDSEDIPEKEAKLIKVKKDYINQLNLDYKIEWLKRNCPNASKNIKSYIKEKMKLINSFNI